MQTIFLCIASHIVITHFDQIVQALIEIMLCLSCEAMAFARLLDMKDRFK